MKLRGQPLIKPEPLPVVFPRQPAPDGTTRDIVIWLFPIYDSKEFDKQFSIPTPPKIWNQKTRSHEANINSPVYIQAVTDYSNLLVNWRFLKTINANAPESELILETVDLANSDTWGNWKTEMEQAGFTDGELLHLLNETQRANGLQVDAYEKAKDAFLTMLRQKEEQTQPLKGGV